MTKDNFSFSCKSLVVGGYHFGLDLSADSVEQDTQKTPPTVTTRTTGAALCRALERDEGKDKDKESPLLKCPNGASVCQVVLVSDEDSKTSVIAAIKPFALAANLPTAKDFVVKKDGKGFDLFLKGADWGSHSLATNASFVCGEKKAFAVSPLSTDSTLVLTFTTPAACGTKNGSIGEGV
ncbi:UNVERIFIED_CONTAM: hypothetical protein HDU68_007259 [Siphonaria sp. JEL0065]|nr:hypothetical protein HDU68_007259 [Siphonaria sp. JEL0065]